MTPPFMAPCCERMLRNAGWYGEAGDVRVCPNPQCRRSWAWDAGAWWPGPVEEED